MDYVFTTIAYISIISILLFLSSWKLFKKLGYNPLLALIPVRNYQIILKEAKQPIWWAFLIYLPIVGTIMIAVCHLFFVKKFGKTGLFDKILTVVLGYLYLARINYFSELEIVSDDDEDDESSKKESFIGSVTFAVVFATIIHTVFIQPFGIPTGSMERTLLVGDFLFVNKWTYGYRLPMRPVAIPFLQGTIYDIQKDGNPKNDPKSYLEAVKLPYTRIFQFKKPQKNDIVVFNYPQDSVHTAIDRKDPYVKRCVAVAGDVLEMRAGKLFINGKPEVILGDAQQQHSFILQTSSAIDIPSLFKKLEFFSVENVELNGRFNEEFFSKYKLSPSNTIYRMQLTDKMVAELKQLPEFVSIHEEIEDQGKAKVVYFDQNQTRIFRPYSIFPINKPWNEDWFGPLKIPKKGDVITVNQETFPQYEWLISQYEKNTLENKNGKIFINGKETNQYTVQQDYYFMMGDNRDGSLDARFFGFVPEENIVGSPMFTWMSVEGLFTDQGSDYQADGKRIRWDRMFKATNTGEANKTSYWWLAAIILIVFFGWEFITKPFKKKDSE